jgi:sugar/nucleoside kinase (ribokinase family)
LNTKWPFTRIFTSMSSAVGFPGVERDVAAPARVIRRRYARATLVVLTAGAWALTGDRVVHQPTLATAVVDTTGCGDAFQGAFTVAHFGGVDLAGALRAGARAAAAVAARYGA